jgi:hypothetical protein
MPYDSLHHYYRMNRLPHQKVGKVVLVEVPVVRAIVESCGYSPRKK